MTNIMMNKLEWTLQNVPKVWSGIGSVFVWLNKEFVGHESKCFITTWIVFKMAQAVSVWMIYSFSVLFSMSIWSNLQHHKYHRIRQEQVASGCTHYL